MKFLPRAAIAAAVSLCVGALANAATLDPNLQDVPVSEINAQILPVVPPAPAQVTYGPKAEIVQPTTADDADADIDYNSLASAVAAQDAPADLDSELNCLAIGVYYEAKGEPLAGQLAVADVILNRTNSGRFPKSVCSVIKQPGQFSFVRGGKLPTPPANAQWSKALAVAQVAQKDLWDSPAGDALYFHARYVNAGWSRDRVATVGNHIFYR
jgi:spore germination cell wall hydrolase CwlJ-like protein